MGFQLTSSAYSGLLIAADYSRDIVFRWPHDPSSGWWKPEKHHWFNGMTLPRVEAAIASGEAFRLHGDPGGPLPLPPGIQRCGVCGDPVRSPRCRCRAWVASGGWSHPDGWRVQPLVKGWGFVLAPQDEVSEAPEGGPQMVDLLRN